MPKGIKGFQMGHETSAETRRKIGNANRRPVYFLCDYCGNEDITKPSALNRKKRHFCSTRCYADYRREVMPPCEHPCWTGGVTSAESYRRWKKKNPKRLAHLKARRYARERGAEGSHTYDEWESMKISFGNKCAYCNEGKPLTKDHILPLSEGGSDYISNIQPLCRNCNSKKWKSIHQNPELLDA